MSEQPRPSILLVTLDTTRADAIGPEAIGVVTPAYNALAARGRRFTQAYTTVPQTLPAHCSLLSGLYPGGHGIHENGRNLPPGTPLLSERLHDRGYRTAAFVSSFTLAHQFGLARGFDLYDDDTPSPALAERSSLETTNRALTYLDQASPQPLLLWVHYYDAHAPYEPPEPFRTRYASNPYLGEVAAVDEQLARLVAAFEKKSHGPHAIVVVGDHGEGLGEHGEAQHGNLLYQATMRVPLLIAGPGVTQASMTAPVSTRRVFQTILDFAGLGAAGSLRGAEQEVVAGEAMKPFLEYGWQPQVMALEGRRKAIRAGALEVYDVIADPGETHNLAAQGDVPRAIRTMFHDYPIPTPGGGATPQWEGSDEERKKLASLGYMSASATPVTRADAPRPADMVALFPLLDRASGLFVKERYAEAIPVLEKIQAADPYNLDVALRLASAHSSLGHDQQALAAFRKAEAIAPASADVRTYLALHYARGKDWPHAVPMLERIVAEWPGKVAALEALVLLRERQGRIDDSATLREKLYTLRTPSAGELLKLGTIEMQRGQTAKAIDAFERARKLQGTAFGGDLELGVLYLASGRLADARDALDRVPFSHRSLPLALFKRAQVSVLLNEPDAESRIEAARKHADATTSELIARERLFRPTQ